MVTVGIVGAGLMGTACAHRLMRAGFDVLAYDIDVTRRSTIANLGARVGLSVADTAAHACMLVLAVFNTDQVEAVIEGEGGVLEALRPGAAALPVMCVSTCDPQRLAALAARVAPRGVLFVEAPISGTSRQVEAGDGVGLIGGDPAAIERAASALDAICPRRFHLGAVGNGSRAKLAVNLILGLNRAAMAEGLVLAERLGLDPVAFLEVARGSAAYSQVMDVKGELMARRQFHSPQSRVAQSLKDFRLMLEQGGAAGQELPFASVYAALLEDCVRRGEAEWDNAAIIEAIRRRATR